MIGALNVGSSEGGKGLVRARAVTISAMAVTEDFDIVAGEHLVALES